MVFKPGKFSKILTVKTAQFNVSCLFMDLEFGVAIRGF